MTSAALPSRLAPQTRTRSLAFTLGVGAILAVLAIAYWSSATPVDQVTMESSRATLISNSISVLNQGGPPLTASSVPYKEGLENPEGSFYAANQGDDEGIYLYLPVAGHWLGIDDPRSLLKWMFVLCMALVVLLYPTMFYALTGSRAAAVVAPLAVIFGFGFLVNSDIYWVPAWGTLLGLPLVYLAARGRWRRRYELLLLVAAALVASFTTSIRAHGGTGVVIAALLVVLLRERSWRAKAAGAALVFVAYLSIATFALTAVRDYRDHVVKLAPSSLPTTHPFWHPAYLGLGYLPNRWGIRWDDPVAFHAAQRVDPTVQYLSPHYESILRHLYMKILRADPGYVVRVYAVKAAIVLRSAFERYGWALLALPFLLAYGRRRRTLRLEVALAVPALLLAVVPPILTVPQTYDVGFLATCGLLALMVVVTALAALAGRPVPSAAELWTMFDGLPARAGLLRLRDFVGEFPRPATRSVRAAAVAAVLLAAAIAGVVAYAGSNDSVVSYSSESWYREPAPHALAEIATWSGPDALQAWDVYPGVATTPAGSGFEVTSAPQSGSTVLTSPAAPVKAGTYALVVDGTVASGGVQLGVWDVTHDTWDGQRLYSAADSGAVGGAMVVPFSMSEASTVQVRLVNWAQASSSSTTQIVSTKLVRVAPGTVSN